MNINNKYKLEKSVSDDPFRKRLHHIYADKEKTRLVVCDGAQLVIVNNVEFEESDTSGAISIDAWKEANRLGKKFGRVVIEANGALKLENGATFERPELDRVANYDEVLPKKKPEFVVILDAQRLFEIAQAVGAKNKMGEFPVKLEFTDEFSPVRVTSAESPDAFGVLQPCRIAH